METRLKDKSDSILKKFDRYLNEGFGILDAEIGKLRAEIQTSKVEKNATTSRTDEEINPYLDSVPCCGEVNDLGTDEWVDEGVGDTAESANMEDMIQHVMSQLPEEERKGIEEFRQELEEFRATLSEEELAKLEEGKRKRIAKLKSQALTMIAALPEDQQRQAQRNLKFMEIAWEITADADVLSDMLAEKEIQKHREETSHLRIGVIAPTPEEQKRLEEEWKMQEVLRMIEEAAREQMGRFLRFDFKSITSKY